MGTITTEVEHSRLYGEACEAHTAAIEDALQDVKTHDGTFDTALGEATQNEAFCRAMQKLYAYLVDRKNINAIEATRLACDVELEFGHAALAYAERVAGVRA